jgi:hypothetical protein
MAVLPQHFGSDLQGFQKSRIRGKRVWNKFHVRSSAAVFAASATTRLVRSCGDFGYGYGGGIGDELRNNLAAQLVFNAAGRIHCRRRLNQGATDPRLCGHAPVRTIGMDAIALPLGFFNGQVTMMLLPWCRHSV